MVFESGGTACRRAASGEDPDGEIDRPGRRGWLHPGGPRPGPHTAGATDRAGVLAVLAFADDQLGTEIGPLTAPMNVR